jgi:hypothetical protein
MASGDALAAPQDSIHPVFAFGGKVAQFGRVCGIALMWLPLAAFTAALITGSDAAPRLLWAVMAGIVIGMLFAPMGYFIWRDAKRAGNEHLRLFGDRLEYQRHNGKVESVRYDEIASAELVTLTNPYRFPRSFIVIRTASGTTLGMIYFSTRESKLAFDEFSRLYQP